MTRLKCLYCWHFEENILAGVTLLIEYHITAFLLYRLPWNQTQAASTRMLLGNVHLLSEGGKGRKWGVYEKLVRSEGGL